MKIGTRDASYAPKAEGKGVTLITKSAKNEGDQAVTVVDRMTPDEADVLALSLTKAAAQARKNKR